MLIKISDDGTEITLPTGHVVVGSPRDTDSYRQTAIYLGYDSDTLAMCKDHDPLHVLLSQWLGIETSFSLLRASGLLDDGDSWKADLEEQAVMAVQRYMRMCRGRLPLETEVVSELE